MVIDKANILVVDDDDEVRGFLVELLVRDGYRVSAAANISEAISKLKGDIFDVVLLDLKLPDVGGTDGITQVKDVSPHSKIIIVTAFPSVDTATVAMKSGAIDYLKKPFRNEELLTLIEDNVNLEARQEILPALGEKIRFIRKEKGIRIKQLSTRSGLTESSISMIENGKISPSVTTLSKIAMALGVHPVELFEIEKHKKWTVTQKGVREIIQFPDTDSGLEYLMKDRKDNNEIFISHLGPEQKSFDNPVSHKGYKLGYVLKGAVELELEAEKVQLYEGDSIFFDAAIPHLWKSMEGHKSSTLWIIDRDHS